MVGNDFAQDGFNTSYSAAHTATVANARHIERELSECKTKGIIHRLCHNCHGIAQFMHGPTEVHIEQGTPLDDQRQVIHFAGNVDLHPWHPTVENLDAHFTHHLLIRFNALTVHGGHDQAALLAMGRVVDKQHTLPNNPACPRPVNHRGDQEVFHCIYQDIAVRLGTMQDSTTKAQKMEAHDITIAPVGLE